MAAVSSNLDIYIRAYDEVTETLKQVATDLQKLITSVQKVGTESGTTSKELKTLADATLDAGSAADKAAKQELGFLKSLEGVVGGLRALAYGFAGLGIVQFLKGLADTAARTEVLGTVLYQVARNAGISREEIDKTDKAVQKLGITAAASRQSITQLIQADIFQPEQIRKYATELARASQDLAVISGTNSSDTFSRLIVNINQMDTLGLRWMGLMVDKQRVFAESAQKAGRELTTTEKKLAFTNATLAEAAKLAGVYELAMNDVGKQLTSLPRLIEAVRESLGNYLLPAYSALVQALKEFLEYLAPAIGEQGKFSDGAQALAASVKFLATQFFDLVKVLIEFKDVLFLLAGIYVFDKMVIAGKAALDLFTKFTAAVSGLATGLARFSAGVGLILGSVFGDLGLKLGGFAATIFQTLGSILSRALPLIGAALLTFNVADYLIQGTDLEPYWEWMKDQVKRGWAEVKLAWEEGKNLIGLGNEDSLIDAQLEADEAYITSLKSIEERRAALKGKTNQEILNSLKKTKGLEIEYEERLRTEEDVTVKDALANDLKLLKSKNAKTVATLNNLEATGKLTEEEIRQKKAIEATDLAAVLKAKEYEKLTSKVAQLAQDINADFKSLTEGVGTKLSSTVENYVQIVETFKERGLDASNAVTELVTTFDGLIKKANPKELDLIASALEGLIPQVDEANAEKLKLLLESIGNYRTDAAVKENEKLAASFTRLLDKLTEFKNSLNEQEQILRDLQNAQGDLDAELAASRGDVGASYDVEIRKIKEAVENARTLLATSRERDKTEDSALQSRINRQITLEEQAQKKKLDDALKVIDEQYSAELKKAEELYQLKTAKTETATSATAYDAEIAAITKASELRKAAADEEYNQKVASFRLDSEREKNLVDLSRFQTTLTEEEVALKKQAIDEEFTRRTLLEGESLLQAKNRIDSETSYSISALEKLRQEKEALNKVSLEGGFATSGEDFAKKREEEYQKEIASIKKRSAEASKAKVEEFRDSAQLKSLREQLSEAREKATKKDIASLQVYQGSLKKALGEAEAAYKAHIQKLNDLQKEAKSLAKSEAQDLLEIDNLGKDKETIYRNEVKSYNKERNQAEVEYAKVVLKRNDADLAATKELYETQISNAKKLAKEASERGDTRSVARYRRDIEDYYGTLKKINAEEQKQEKDAAAKAKEQLDAIKEESFRVAEELVTKLAELFNQNALNLAIDADSGYINDTTIPNIQALLAAATYTINVQANVTGLPGTAEITPPTPAPGTTLPDGRVVISAKAGGGLVEGPGTDTSDNLLAWLSPNEFVLRAKAVKNLIREYGINALNYINEFGKLPQFAFGGMVPSLNMYHTTNNNDVRNTSTLSSTLKSLLSLPRFFRGGAVTNVQHRVTKPDVVRYLSSVMDIPRFSSGGYVNPTKVVSNIIRQDSFDSVSQSSTKASTPTYLTPLHLHLPGGDVLTAKVDKLEEDAIKKYLAKENLKRGRR